MTSRMLSSLRNALIDARRRVTCYECRLNRTQYLRRTGGQG